MTFDPSFSAYDNWSLTVQMLGMTFSAIGFVAVAISLYLGRKQVQHAGEQTRLIAEQLKMAAEQAERVAQESSSGQVAAIDGIFVQYPEMYPYFYQGEPLEKDSANYYKALTFAMSMANYVEALMPKDGASLEPWLKKYLLDQFTLSPILCEYLESVPDWFNPKVYTLMAESKARTDLPSRPFAPGLASHKSVSRPIMANQMEQSIQVR